ncbi:hypothetical protein ABPG77_004118 [Micractinium sp. CCAP 211/92]
MDTAPSAGPARKARVSYFYDPEVGQFYYGQGHPMKPHRVRMAHSLVLHYGLYSKLDGYYTPTRATAEDLAVFHSQDYVDFLKTITPDNLSRFTRELREFNMYEDCPVFDGLYQYCQIAAGGSLGAAVKLNYQTSDIAINWAGGLHHAKRAEASGFCYVNDIVLAILELLKYHQRVLYLDIDVHHGDGVEEAFLTTDRVMTVSFHKFGNGYFPGTGDLRNMGHGNGKGYALNVPLRDGITDDTYHSLFRPVMAKVMEVYRPEAIVLQCGATPTPLLSRRSAARSPRCRNHGGLCAAACRPPHATEASACADPARAAPAASWAAWLAVEPQLPNTPGVAALNVLPAAGTDSLAGDRLGVFNLSSKGHAACVDFMKSFGLPLMLLGGGGYKIINVARCWAAETGLAVGADMAEQLPANEYYDYYAPVGHTLTVQPISGWDNWNTPEYVDGLRNTILQRLSEMQGAPGVAFHERAPDGLDPDAIQVGSHGAFTLPGLRGLPGAGVMRTREAGWGWNACLCVCLCVPRSPRAARAGRPRAPDVCTGLRCGGRDKVEPAVLDAARGGAPRGTERMLHLPCLASPWSAAGCEHDRPASLATAHLGRGARPRGRASHGSGGSRGAAETRHQLQGPACQQAAVPQHAASALGVAPHRRQQQGRRRGRHSGAGAEHAEHARGGRGRASRRVWRHIAAAREEA